MGGLTFTRNPILPLESRIWIVLYRTTELTIFVKVPTARSLVVTMSPGSVRVLEDVFNQTQSCTSGWNDIIGSPVIQRQRPIISIELDNRLRCVATSNVEAGSIDSDVAYSRIDVEYVVQGSLMQAEAFFPSDNGRKQKK